MKLGADQFQVLPLEYPGKIVENGCRKTNSTYVIIKEGEIKTNWSKKKTDDIDNLLNTRAQPVRKYNGPGVLFF